MLARIESTPGVKQAWISRDGAFVVVRPRGGAEVADALQALLVAEREAVTRLEGTNLATVLDLFDAERREWIRGATNTRELTRIEADIVAARIADRVAARAPLEDAERRAIETAVARAFYGAVMRGEDVPTDLPAALASLRPEVRDALREAVALGYRPASDEP